MKQKKNYSLIKHIDFLFLFYHQKERGLFTSCIGNISCVGHTGSVYRKNYKKSDSSKENTKEWWRSSFVHS